MYDAPRKCSGAHCMVGEQFLVANSWLWFHTFLTRIMWRHVISPSFREWNLHYKGAVSTNSLSFWTSHHTQFAKVIFSGVSSCVGSEGNAVKGTTTNGNKAKRIFRCGRGVGTFGYALIWVSLKISNPPVLLRMWCYVARDHTIPTTVTTCRCVNLVSVVEYDCLILWA
jgi:hypothetical protein